MPRVAPHHHPCQRCGVKTECGGTWVENYDGHPEVICDEFHTLTGSDPDFMCEACWRRAEDAHTEEETDD